MDTPIRSLHHVTATVAGAQEDLDFYAGLLGLRLVKKTVNFDNHDVYHFYYGDARGTPSTLWTTFPYRGWGVPPGTNGAGQVTVTAFSVPAGSLDFWRRRLAAARVSCDEGRRFGAACLAFQDPSGLAIELVEGRGDTREPWLAPGIDPAAAFRGLHGVTLTVRSASPTIQFLTELLGFELVGEEGPRTRLGVGGGGPGRLLEVLAAPDAPDAVNGLGTVHHVALAIDNAEQQLELRRELVRAGRQVTEIRDRQYFLSIYFREPGGVLYEVATIGPGFMVDEEQSALGGELKLPPWEEQHRAAIEARLPDISVPSS